MHDFIISKGGFSKSAVSGKTNYLLIGSKLEDGREVTEGRKYRMAIEKKTEILNEAEFEEFIREKTGLKNFSFSKRADMFGATDDLDKLGEKDMEAESATLWTEIYRPRSINDIVGNQACVQNLFEWLRDWHNVHVLGEKKQVRFNAGRFIMGLGWQNAPNPNAKAAMLSGPPGIGKTSACRIVCKHLGYELLEMNASDCRNKFAIESSISSLASNQSIDYWTQHGQQRREKNLQNEFIQAFGG